MNLPIIRAAEVLLGGGIIAYPTEGVFGLGCMPDDSQALERLLDIKQRDPAKGLILIAANASQFDGWVETSDLARLPAADADCPVTWIASPGPNVGPLIRGDNDGVAVRLTTNPVAAAICEEVSVTYLRRSPITIASLMNGEVFRLFSISEGEMFFPPDVMMMSLIRSTILTWVPSTHSPTSPVFSHPSSVSASAVASGLFQ